MKTAAISRLWLRLIPVDLTCVPYMAMYHAGTVRLSDCGFRAEQLSNCCNRCHVEVQSLISAVHFPMCSMHHTTGGTTRACVAGREVARRRNLRSLKAVDPLRFTCCQLGGLRLTCFYCRTYTAAFCILLLKTD